MARKSVLFSPGDQPDLLEKAPNAGADVVVFDLEDAVAPGKKDAARSAVTAVLEGLPSDNPNFPEVCVRINPLDIGGNEDIQAIVDASVRPDSLMVPKVDTDATIADVSTASDRLRREGERDGGPGSLPILALLETASGILNAPSIAAHPATDAVLFGAEDLAADVGATRTAEGTEVLYARQRTVLAAANAGIDAIDTLHTDYEDSEGLAEDVETALSFGFDGKMAIHPAQVSVINAGFTPPAEDVEWAKRVLEGKAEAEAADRGVFSVDGEMIDAPLVTQAETILDRAGLSEQA